MNNLIIMMNLCTPMNLFPGFKNKYAMHGKTGLSKAYLFKIPGIGVHLVHRFINFINKVKNILNIYHISYKYDEPMNPDVPRVAYAIFLPCLKKGDCKDRKNGQKEMFFEGQTTSRYTGSS